ncbi:MAG TPA: hypothetical protein VJM08_08830 [Anaerolineales bacterium]|nr:hypothetical protein [Anaerolineales bacterium]
MTTKQVADLCGLYSVAEFANDEDTKFIMYLMGTGVTRSLYELTAHDRKTHALLFDIQVEAATESLHLVAVE